MIYPIVIVLRELGIYGTLTGLIIVHIRSSACRS
jgi:ABC-type glycerol-3-phosphate transport system permease component